MTKFPSHLLRLFVSTFLSLSVLGAISTPLTANHHEEGWTNLVNGESLEGWFNPFDWGEAVVKDGEVHLNTIKKKFFLLTEHTYKDFIFEAEIRLPEGKSNSGFMFRCHYEPNRVWGYQAEVDPSDRSWSGGLYDEGRRGWLHPRQPADSDYNKENWPPERRNAYKQNEWNRYRIHCEGNRIRIYVNDVLTTDVDDNLDQEGRIGLQHHGEVGQVYRFRNIRIKKL